MIKSKLNTIKLNNTKINSLIQEIIDFNPEEAFTNNENGNYEITAIYKKIIAFEIEKLLKIYHLEFPNLPYDKNRKLDISVYEGTHIDACYYNNTLGFSSGIKTGFKLLKAGKLDSTNIGYSIKKDGRVIFVENGLTEKLHTNFIDKKDGTPFIITEEELVENDFSDLTQMLYYYLNNSKYETFFFSVIPHECAHAFGFGGKLFEGLTENLTREVSVKYNLLNKPFSRQHLVKLFQKIEKVIGRDKLVEHSHIHTGNTERTAILSTLIDDKLQPDEKDLFKKLCDLYLERDLYASSLDDTLLHKVRLKELTMEEADKIFKGDEKLKAYKESEKVYFQLLEKYLDEYISQNSKKLFCLGETSITANLRDFEEVISFQENEINILNEILEKIREKNF